jgi:hypothetical protein
MELYLYAVLLLPIVFCMASGKRKMLYAGKGQFLETSKSVGNTRIQKNADCMLSTWAYKKNKQINSYFTTCVQITF